MEDGKLEVVIVSGLSGAGKTVALRALEDIGYFCIDNLPVVLIDPFLSTVGSGEKIKRVGIGVDIREKFFLSDAYNIFAALKKRYKIEILFLEAEKDVMLRRYRETRRPHPMLSINKEMDMEAAIEEERVFLSVIRDASDKIIDTSNYTPHQLRHLVISMHENIDLTRAINISIISFGYKYGTPHDIDLLFDVRFLPNPYFIPDLKPLKGIDVAVADFILKREETKEFLLRMTALLDFLIPHYITEGRSYLVIAIGCTGGRHRSPAIVEEISKDISLKHGITPNIIHRDME